MPIIDLLLVCSTQVRTRCLMVKFSLIFMHHVFMFFSLGLPFSVRGQSFFLL